VTFNSKVSVNSNNTLKHFIFISVHCLQPDYNTQTTKCTVFFLRYLHYNTTLSIPTCFNPQVIVTREVISNKVAWNKIIYLYSCRKRIK